MLRKLFKIAVILFFLPFVLVLVYAVIPPVSVPIAGSALMLEIPSWRWRSYDKISPHLPRMIIAAEDARFCEHDGVDWKAVEKVAKDGRRTGKLKRGASTIAMQTAKNLFLWHLPKIIRKPMELPLAMWIDLVWSKKRLIEVYMNIAQMGDGVYGAEAASQLYFKKPASKLTPAESAVLAAVLPSPEKRKANKPSKYTGKYAASIRSRASQNLVKCLN